MSDVDQLIKELKNSKASFIETKQYESHHKSMNVLFEPENGLPLLLEYKIK